MNIANTITKLRATPVHPRPLSRWSMSTLSSLLLGKFSTWTTYVFHQSHSAALLCTLPHRVELWRTGFCKSWWIQFLYFSIVDEKINVTKLLTMWTGKQIFMRLNPGCESLITVCIDELSVSRRIKALVSNYDFENLTDCSCWTNGPLITCRDVSVLKVNQSGRCVTRAL